jgi:4'-phosphopantetheinyl transferase
LNACGSQDLFVSAASVLACTDIPALDGADVHLWPVDLQADSAVLARCSALLTDSERTQAARFVFEHDRIAYTVSHGVMRHLLGIYGADAAAEFVCSSAGKPRLADASVGLHFNLSHSHSRALVGFCRRQIGVDLEMVRKVEVFEIAEAYFFGTELAAIRESASPQDEFFRYWVCKEAVLKGEGIGLGFDLDQFAVALATDGVATVRSLDETKLANDWHVRQIACGRGWYGAVAMRGELPRLRIQPPVSSH